MSARTGRTLNDQCLIQKSVPLSKCTIGVPFSWPIPNSRDRLDGHLIGIGTQTSGVNQYLVFREDGGGKIRAVCLPDGKYSHWPTPPFRNVMEAVFGAHLQ